MFENATAASLPSSFSTSKRPFHSTWLLPVVSRNKEDLSPSPAHIVLDPELLPKRQRRATLNVSTSQDFNAEFPSRGPGFRVHSPDATPHFSAGSPPPDAPSIPQSPEPDEFRVEYETNWRVDPTCPVLWTTQQGSFAVRGWTLWEMLSHSDPVEQLTQQLTLLHGPRRWRDSDDFTLTIAETLESHACLASLCGERMLRGVALFAVILCCFCSGQLNPSLRRCAVDRNRNRTSTMDRDLINLLCQEVFFAHGFNITLSGTEVMNRRLEGYEEKGFIGRGAFGDVKHMRRRRDNAPVAVKQIRLTEEPAVLLAVEREVGALTRIGRSSPYVLHFHDVFERQEKTARYKCIVTELSVLPVP